MTWVTGTENSSVRLPVPLHPMSCVTGRNALVMLLMRSQRAWGFHGSSLAKLILGPALC
jgi:hypothetical protein